MGRLGDMIVEEIGKIDYDVVLPISEPPNKCQVDVRNWSVMAQTKAIYSYVVENWETVFIANGGFQNNTNYLGSPPFNPFYTPTPSVFLKSETPKFKSHKKLYDIMLPYFKTVDDTDMVFVDMFQRIFIDWLGVLEVGCGQDSDVLLPLIQPNTFNTAPPFFHSADGGTLDRHTPEDIDYDAYPNKATKDIESTDNEFVPDQRIIDYFDSRLNELSIILEKAVYRLSNNHSGEINESEIQIREDYIILWWERPKEVKEIQKKNYQEIGDIEYAKLKKEPHDINRLNALNSENASLGKSVSDEYDRMLEEVTIIGETDWVISGRGESEARVVAITNEIQEIDNLKNDYLSGKLPEIDTVLAPDKVSIGSLHPDAPNMSDTRLYSPSPLDWVYPIQSGLPALQVPVFFTWPTCIENAIACARDVMSRSDEVRSDGSMVHRIIADWIVTTLNQAVPVFGGVRGYCYGIPLNEWTGVVVGTISWSD